MDFHKPRYTPMSRRRRIYEGKAKVLYEGPGAGNADPAFQGRRDRLQRQEARGDRRQGRPQQPHLGIRVPAPQRHRGADALHPPAQHARAVDPRGRNHSARGRGAQRRGRLAGAAPRHRGRHAAAALDHRVLLQERQAQRPDGVGGAHHRLRLGDAAGDRRHHGAGHPRQRFPLRPLPRRRHPSGRLQDGNRPAVGKRHDAHRRGRRDLARFVPAVGHQDRTRSSTRTASAAISAGWSRPIPKSPSASAS